MEILYNHAYKEYISKLYLTEGFKYDVKYPVPKTISTISYGDRLLNYIDIKDIPYSVTMLEYCNGLGISPTNHHITKVPPSILHLNVSNGFIKRGDIPFGLKSINVGHCFDGLEFLPNSIEKLEIVSLKNDMIRPTEIPSSVQTLKIIWYNRSLLSGDLPKSITFLEILNFNQPLTKSSIPKNVKTLILQSFNQVLSPGVLPNSITFLKLTSFNQILGTIGVLPSKLEYLEFGKFNKQLKTPIGILPSTIKTLILGKSFNCEIEIPINVSTLNFGGSFSQPLEIESIPQSITKLVLNINYKNIIKKELLKNSTIKYLTLIPKKPQIFIKGKMYNGK